MTSNLFWLTKIVLTHYCKNCKKTHIENSNVFVQNINTELKTRSLYKTCINCSAYEPMELHHIEISPGERVLK